ncbi:MAG: VTC domain-containing protein, partial [Caldilineaceae bacterium]
MTFTPIALDERKEVALLDRSEVKYTVSISALLACLPDLRAAYRALEVDSRGLNRYRTLYFDTLDFQLYRRRHMGACNRYKVRSREYEDTHLSFLEVKHKTSNRRTIKHRMSTQELVIAPDDNTSHFLDQVS